jgi:hypothetical protein
MEPLWEPMTGVDVDDPRITEDDEFGVEEIP